jgi:hypothetical protein
VLLVFSDRALERWFSSGAEAEPGDERIHHLKDAFVLPELRHGGRPIQGLSTTRAQLGKEGGPLITFGASDIRLGGDDATDAVAMNAKVLDALSALKDAITDATPAAGASDGGAGLQASLLLKLADWPPASVGSSIVKVK